MTLYSSPPPQRTFQQDQPTLLVCWWCTLFAGSIVLFRLAGRYIRSERLFREDKIAAASLIPLFARMAFVHVVLLWGTNNTVTTGLTSQEIYNRSIGSRMLLVSRILYAATLWMFKFAITEFFKRLTLQIWRRSYEVMLQGIRWFLVASFVAIVISDLAECSPFTHYWQVVPDPGGACRQGYAQLLTMGVCNIITDLTLIVFPIPIIQRSAMPRKRKLQLIALFSLSIAPIITTLYRLPVIIDQHGSQQRRSLLASVEILFAAAAANALILGSFVRDRGVKKVRWRAASVSESADRSFTRRGTVIRQWGSDEDLVRDLGMGVDPELRESDRSSTPSNHSSNISNVANSNWNFQSSSTDSNDFLKVTSNPPNSHYMTSPRKVSFFDVGGLLNGEEIGRHSTTTQSTLDTIREARPDLARSLPSKKDAAAFLQDSGTYASAQPKMTRTNRSGSATGSGSGDEPMELQSMQSRGHTSSPRISRGPSVAAIEDNYTPPPPSFLEDNTIPSLQFKDVGGLLR